MKSCSAVVERAGGRGLGYFCRFGFGACSIDIRSQLGDQVLNASYLIANRFSLGPGGLTAFYVPFGRFEGNVGTLTSRSRRSLLPNNDRVNDMTWDLVEKACVRFGSGRR